VLGQALLHVGRKAEAKKELDAAIRITNQHHSETEKQTDSETIPSPELLQEPQ